jgi:hypothetical protein
MFPSGIPKQNIPVNKQTKVGSNGIVPWINFGAIGDQLKGIDADIFPGLVAPGGVRTWGNAAPTAPKVNVPAPAPGGDTTGGGTGGSFNGGSIASFDPEALAKAQAAAKVAQLRGDIKGKRQAIQDAYNALFGDIDTLARDRSAEVEKKAGKNIEDLTDQYTQALPGIDNSFAALGAGDSTDTRDAKIKAKSGFDKSVEEVGETKKQDLSKIGTYVNENKGKWNAERDSVLRLIDRVDDTEDVGDLNEARNTVENKTGELGSTRATLMTDDGARGKLSEITQDGGRYEAIKGSLDNIIKSSMSGGVKAAAVQAIADSSDLSDEEKEKVKVEYGNVYNAPTA